MNRYEPSKTDTVYITGHKNPDSDSICTSIAYARLKNLLGTDATPVRIGKINRETEFILKYFGFDAPKYLATVKMQVSDLNMDKIDPVPPSTSIRDAWQKLKENNLEVLPVGNTERVLSGIVSVSDIANAYINTPNSNGLSESGTSVENVIRSLDATRICGSRKNFDGSGKVVIAAMMPDGMDGRLKNGDVVIAGNIKGNQVKAIEAGADCLILTCGSDVSEEVAALAESRGCTVLTTRYDTFTAARLIYQSMPVQSTMTTENLVLFHIDDYLDDVKDKMLSTRFRSYPVLDSDNRFLGFISRYHLLNRRRKKIILVDHSETAQSVNGVEQAEILEIVDHHRIGNIQTSSPIYYRNEPTGSTATIVANIYSEQGIKPPPPIAGILCAAIISDTIKFKSTTSTHADRITAERLANLAGIEIDAFAGKMFGAGSSIKNLSAKEIVESDFKEYDIGKYRIGIGQVNTMELRSLKKMRQPILDCLESMIENEQFSIVLMLFTDIMEEQTEVLFAEKRKGLVAGAFSPLQDENSFFMNGIVSRKKQIVPALISSLSE